MRHMRIVKFSVTILITAKSVHMMTTVYIFIKIQKTVGLVENVKGKCVCTNIKR